MKKALWLFILFALPCAGFAQVYGFSVGESGTVKITPKDLLDAPAWNEKDKNPPLSVRDAIAAAKKYFVKHAPRSLPWEVSGVRLRPLGETPGYWVYQVHFRGMTGPETGTKISVHFASVAFLMNGKVVEPEPLQPGHGIQVEEGDIP